MRSRGPVWPTALFAVGGVALSATVGAQVYVSSDADFARDGWAIVVPWVLVSLAGLVAFVVRRPLAVLLLASAAAIVLRYCGPLTMKNLQGYWPAVFWGTPGIPREPWVLTIIEGRNDSLRAILLAQVVACLVLAAGALHLTIELWPGSARERRWDGILVTASVAFGLACLVLAPYGATSHVSWTNLAEYGPNRMLFNLGLSWVLPVAGWAVVQVGRSGWESIAGAAGLVVATLLVPVTVDVLARMLGGYTSIYAYPGDLLPDYPVAASSVLDLYGFWWFVPAASVLLLLVASVRHAVLGRRVAALGEEEAG